MGFRRFAACSGSTRDIVDEAFRRQGTRLPPGASVTENTETSFTVHFGPAPKISADKVAHRDVRGPSAD